MKRSGLDFRLEALLRRSIDEIGQWSRESRKAQIKATMLSTPALSPPFSTFRRQAELVSACNRVEGNETADLSFSAGLSTYNDANKATPPDRSNGDLWKTGEPEEYTALVGLISPD